MVEIEKTLSSLGFPEENIVSHRSSIADLYRPGKRCGIYILSFSNNEWYCGQAVDVARRYVQHTKIHPDIETIRFREVPQAELNQIERTTIQKLEQQGFRLRNISLTSIPKGESDFDLIMSLEEQDRWLEDTEFLDIEGSRVENPVLRRKYNRKFKKFSEHPLSEKIVAVLRDYVQCCLPAVKRGEIAFWSISCMPSTDMSLARININWQEVCCAYETWYGKEAFAFHMTKSSLSNRAGFLFYKLRVRYPHLGFWKGIYAPGGPDQVRLGIAGSKSALSLLKRPEIVYSIRLFNLRLMRKGPNTFNRYHCLDLADKLVD